MRHNEFTKSQVKGLGDMSKGIHGLIREAFIRTCATEAYKRLRNRFVLIYNEKELTRGCQSRDFLNE